MTDYDFRDVLEHPYWRHRIKISGERFTPGTKDASNWEALGMPEDMSGKTFLDIGAFDGIHSFEAERRGAERVLATDVWDSPTQDEEWWNSLRPGKKGFQIARSQLDSDVESRTIGVEKISPETVGNFDVVLMSGVIYHLKEPFTAIENAASVARERLVVESAITSEFGEKPGVKFLKSGELDNNPSNWWQPSLTAVENMVQASGAQTTETGTRPMEKSKRKTPELRYGKVKKDSDVFRSPSLRDKISGIPENREVVCLMRYGSSERIEFRKGKVKIQGWIQSDKVEIDPELDLSEDTPRGVVHGYM